MQRPHPAEICPWQVGKIELVRKGKLQRNDEADQHARNAPEHGGHDAGFNDAVGISSAFVLGNAAGIHPHVPGADGGHAGRKRPTLDGHPPVGRSRRFRNPGHEAERQDQRNNDMVETPRRLSARLHKVPHNCPLLTGPGRPGPSFPRRPPRFNKRSARLGGASVRPNSLSFGEACARPMIPCSFMPGSPPAALIEINPRCRPGASRFAWAR